MQVRLGVFSDPCASCGLPFTTVVIDHLRPVPVLLATDTRIAPKSQLQVKMRKERQYRYCLACGLRQVAVAAGERMQVVSKPIPGKLSPDIEGEENVTI